MSLTGTGTDSNTSNTTNSIERDSGISEYAADDEESQMFENRCGLSQDLRFLSGMPELCDVMFLVGEEREPVYGVKAILAIRSRVFYKLLYGPKSGSKQRVTAAHSQLNGGTIGKRLWQKMMPDAIGAVALSSNLSPRDSSHGQSRLTSMGHHGPSTSAHRTVIQIEEFEAEVFKQLLEYIHTGSVVLKPRTLLGLLNAADHFGLEELRRACADFSQKCISLETICALLVTAEFYIQYKSTKIFIQRVLDFVDQHGDDVLQLSEFVHLPRHVVELILSREELDATDLNKFRAAERWCRHYVLYHPNENLRTVMTPFTKYITFHTIPTHILMKEIRPQSIVSDDILMSSLAYQADPQSVSPQEFSRIRPPRMSKNKFRPSVLGSSGDEESNKFSLVVGRTRSVDRNLSKCSNESSNCDSGFNDDTGTTNATGATIVQIECDEAYCSGGRTMSCYELVEKPVKVKF